jgi:ATP-binding cassette subfamily C protein LapB
MTMLGRIEPKQVPAKAEHTARDDAMLKAWIAETQPEELSYDVLSEGLATGRFGGTKSETSAAVALVEVLRLRAWPVDYRRFAEAIPHYSDNFCLNEARFSLHALGFKTDRDRVRGKQLSSLPVGSFVETKDERYLFLRLNARGKPALYDPKLNVFKRIRQRHIYNCVVVEDLNAGSSGRVSKSSWIGQTFNRFGNENRIILMLTFLSNSLIILASLSVGFIFDKVLPAAAYDTLFCLLIGAGMLMFLDLKLRRTRSKIIARVSGRIEYIVSSSLFEKLINFRLEMLTAASVSDQVNRLKQFEVVRDFYCGPIVAVLFEMPFVFFLLLVVFVVSPPVALLLLAVVVAYFVIGLALYSRIKQTSRDMTELRGECLSLQEETVSQRAQIVQRGLGPIWAARLGPKLRTLGLARHRHENVWRSLNSLIAVVTPLAVGGVIVTGALQVIAGSMTGGQLIVCMILSTRLLSPIQQALVVAVRAPEMSNLFQQIDAMMQIPDRHAGRSPNAHRNLQLQAKGPSVTVEGLVLRFPRSVAPALKGVSIKIEGGTFTCVTGVSGSGKSTLLAAIMGHYKPQAGAVMLEATNIDQLEDRAKTGLIAHLGHRSLQIHGTLAQNLRLCKPQATQEDLENVCAELGLLEAINALPEKFETRLDQKFQSRLSLSFKTKLGIAQLLLKNPRVLLLDEPEAGLSSKDEEMLMNVIKSRAGQMTCIMVTHRPSLVRHADRELVLQDGQVRSFGAPTAIEKRDHDVSK